MPATINQNCTISLGESGNNNESPIAFCSTLQVVEIIKEGVCNFPAPATEDMRFEVGQCCGCVVEVKFKSNLFCNWQSPLIFECIEFTSLKVNQESYKNCMRCSIKEVFDKSHKTNYSTYNTDNPEKTFILKTPPIGNYKNTHRFLEDFIMAPIKLMRYVGRDDKEKWLPFKIVGTEFNFEITEHKKGETSDVIYTFNAALFEDVYINL